MANNYPKRRNTLKDYNLNLLSGSEADDYKTDASSYDEDSEEEMADGDEVNSMEDDLDIGVSEKSKPGNGTSRVKKTAGRDDYSKHRDKWPMVRDAGYHIAHPPSMFFKEVTSSPRPNGTHKGKGKNKSQPNVSLASEGPGSSGKPLKDLQRAWMNKSYGALFRNNNNRLREDGPMNCYTAFGGKAGRFLKNEGLHPNLSSGMVDWLHDTTGKVVCPQTIEERQIVRCDENFGEHLHGNPDGCYSIACSHKHVPSNFKHEYRLEGDFLFCH
ncbi:hypothetical protein GTA08_BOTSDO09810 [Neofusicoccum parvum]|uniref:Uncharacterized protein n=1 Tax=Neofusicoccum parvum TaxID=310453 RepID=A0ACB5RS56_9PEZI|nr:hypothetical protein GTA08_BOTSDO09810 [Neofusicoccum parvum]